MLCLNKNKGTTFMESIILANVVDGSKVDLLSIVFLDTPFPQISVCLYALSIFLMIKFK